MPGLDGVTADHDGSEFHPFEFAVAVRVVVSEAEVGADTAAQELRTPLGEERRTKRIGGNSQI